MRRRISTLCKNVEEGFDTADRFDLNHGMGAIRTKSTGGLFPAGLVFDCRASSFDEMESQAIYWNVSSSQLAPGRYSGRHFAIHTGSMQLARTWRSHSTRIEGTVPTDTVVLAIPMSPHTPIQYRGRRLSANSMIFQDHEEGLDFSFTGAIDILTVSVDKNELMRRARTLWNEDPDFRRSMGTLCFPSNPVRQEVAKTIASLVREGALHAAGLATASGARKWENAVLDCALTAIEPRSRLQGFPSRQRSARIAEEYLRANCRQPVSISDLCEVAGTSRRSLHLGFMELYGSAPMRYLHALRLSGVRRHLTSERSSGQRITDIATRWGFDHLGRFATAYKEFFGHLPSATFPFTPTQWPKEQSPPD